MTAIYPIQSNFNKGEISPLLGSRYDIDFWRQSLFLCRNFHILSQGGIRRRSGSRFIAEVRSSGSRARLLPFRFSEDQAYVLVLNNGFIRFCALRGVLGAPYEIAHPYATTELARVSYTQFNDVAFSAHRNRSPRKLTRIADTNWTLTEAEFKDGPYLEEPETTVSLRPAATGEATYASSTQNTSAVGGFQEYDFGPGVFKTVDAYWITGTTAEQTGDSPTGWTFEGWDGSAWVLIDTVEGEAGWARGARHYYTVNNGTAFNKYRFNWTGPQNPSASLLRWGEIKMHQKAEEQTPFNLTASGTSGINNGAGFQATDVGRSIRLLGAANKWQWAKIISRVSATVVTVQLYGHALPTLSPLANWRLGAFSTASGWPAAVALYDERLMWARTDTEPVTVFGSKQGDFTFYGVSDPLVATDGLKITLLSSNMNEILWLADDEEIVTGSAGQIRSVGPADITQSFSATNITQRKGPTSGAAFLQPLSIGGVTLYAGQGGTKIRELVLSEQNRYVAPDLTVLAEHLFKAGIKDWAFAEKPDPTIWAVINDGSLVSITYDREQRVVGFARHDLGGSVENVAVIPGTQPGYDDVYMVVLRTINGQQKRYIEVLERPFDGDIDSVEDAFFVDCGLSYSGSPITTLTGLGHLEGETVLVLADGGKEEGHVVTGGQITLREAASKIHIGLPFTSRAISLPISGPGQDGTLFGRRKNVIAAFVDVMESGALKVGAYMGENEPTRLYEQIMKRGDSLFGTPVELQSGFKRCDIEGSWTEGNGQVVMETSEPLPCLIRSLAFQLENEP